MVVHPFPLSWIMSPYIFSHFYFSCLLMGAAIVGNNGSSF